MYRVTTLALAALAGALDIGSAYAQSLRVSPVTIDLPPQSSSSLLTVENDAAQPIKVQARVFRWSLVNGEDKLEKTSDVVVSPPIFEVKKGFNGSVRVVRISKDAVATEESYRVFVDEIPDRTKQQAGTVALTMRQSIPVFFRAVDAVQSELNWVASIKNNKLFLKATNPGKKHAKLSEMRVSDAANRQVSQLNGLAGYVLAGQTKVWELPLSNVGVSSGTSLSIEAKGDAGPINAKTVVGKSG